MYNVLLHIISSKHCIDFANFTVSSIYITDVNLRNRKKCLR